ncbi:LLM class flavin-dependent oxidoreductase, partial [Streptomyces sp. SID11233]|nr:LLM class flavin-dependent oxidoreductase [Streptomyces sp. SID11233]
PVTADGATTGFEARSDVVQPHSPGLAERLWYGAGSLRSARWAGEQGLNLLTSSVVRWDPAIAQDEGVPPFAAIQR